MNKPTSELREMLSRKVAANFSDGLLLSGGIDSACLASLAPSMIAFTVDFEHKGEDLKFAKIVTKALGMKHFSTTVTVKDAIGAIPVVIRILKTFDPAIPNDIVVYFGLKLAKEKGCRSVMTGDGGDELFGGYSYMAKLNLNEYIPQIAHNLSFSSNLLGAAMGLEIRQPFLDREFIEYALVIDGSEKIKLINGIRYNKWILRKYFENILPNEIVWRQKSPLEQGSGMTILRNILESKISDGYFNMKQEEYKIKFRNKEHLYYYEVYRKVVGEIPQPIGDEVRCLYCGAGIPRGKNHCRVCGGIQSEWSI